MATPTQAFFRLASGTLNDLALQSQSLHVQALETIPMPTFRLCWILLATLGPLAATAHSQVANPNWTKANPTDAGLSDTKLHAMSAAVRSEEFKKIGSILVARHGRLI